MSEVAAGRTLIRPARRGRTVDLGELWHSRELVYFLALRDIKLRYRQTVLGAAWALLQPAVAMIVFSVFLGGFAHIPGDGVPYPVFVYAGLLPWTYFANSTTLAGGSLVKNAPLLSKVYLPRLAIPLASVLSGLLDLLVGFVLLVVLMVVYRVAPTPRLLVLPVLLVAVAVVALAVSTWLAALNVRYRDVHYLTPFLVQVWLFATPVVYPSRLVPESYRWLVGINPMAGVVEGFRWALIGQGSVSPLLLGASAVAVVVLLGTGLAYFRATEGTFADVI